MTDNRLPALRFAPQEDLKSNIVMLILTYGKPRLGADPPPLTLDQPVGIPTGLTVTGGDRACLKPPFTLTAGSECKITLHAQSQWTTGTVIFSFKTGSVRIPVDAYLPPRAMITWDFKVWPQPSQKQDWGLYTAESGKTLNDSSPAMPGYFILSNYIPKHPPSGKLPGISGTAPNCDGWVTLNPTQQIADIRLTTGQIDRTADWTCNPHLSGGVQAKATWDPLPTPAIGAKLAQQLHSVVQDRIAGERKQQ